jgi:hypothetical protein
MKNLPFYAIMLLLFGNMVKSEVSFELFIFWLLSLVMITISNIEPLIKGKDEL